MWASAPALRRNTDFWQKPSARDTALILMCFTMPKAEGMRKSKKKSAAKRANTSDSTVPC